MAAYFIFSYKVNDSEKLYNEYLPKSVETLKGYDMEIIALDKNIEVMEGQTTDTRTVILKFKDRETAKKWYNSPGYQDVINLRLEATEGHAIICDGYEIEAS